MTVELYQQRMIYRNGWAMITETEAAANLFGLVFPFINKLSE
jgi:hypothetical protein